MANARSFDGNAFQLTDLTQELLLIPTQWNLINELGLFGEESVAQHTVTVESSEGTLSVITDSVRGARGNVNSDDVRKLRAFPIPHYFLSDAVKPGDVQGRRQFASPDMPTTEAEVIAKKLERIRRNHDATIEKARAYAICTGGIWAPNGTVDTSQTFYQSFGVSRKDVDYVFGTSTTNMIDKSDEAISHIMDNIQSGETVTRVVALCSPGFFSNLINHATVREAFKYYTSTQEPLRNRLGGMGLYRRFELGNVEYIEYRGSFGGTPLITADEAFMVPVGTNDTMTSYFGPANRFASVNTLGERAYSWMFRDPRDTEITLESESNHLHLLRRPQAVVRLHSSN